MNTKIDRHVRPTYRKPLFASVVSGILFGALLHGCNGSQVGGDNLDAAGPGGGGTQDMAGGGGTGGDMSGQSGYCAGSGPPIVVGDGSGSVSKCTGQVAAAAFRYGLCLCQGLSSGAPIAIDAFDSTQPGATTFGNGGSAGMNSNVNVSNKFSVGGVLQVSGALTLNELTVGSDLLLGDTLSGNGNVTVAKNAQIGGDVKCNGLLKIGGTLTYPTTRTLSATSQAIGQIARAAQLPDEPCRVEGRAARQFGPVDEDDVALTRQREVVGDRGAAHASPDDDDAGTAREGAGRLLGHGRTLAAARRSGRRTV